MAEISGEGLWLMLGIDELLRADCPASFLRKHRLNGPPHLVLQRTNRAMLEKAYSAWLAEAGQADPVEYDRQQAWWPSLVERDNQYDEWGEPIPERYYDRQGREVDPYDVDMDEEGNPVLRRDPYDEAWQPQERLQTERVTHNPNATSAPHITTHERAGS